MKGILDQQCLKKKNKNFQASTHGVADPGLKLSNYNSSLHTSCLQHFIKLSLEWGRIPSPSKLYCGKEFCFALMSPLAPSASVHIQIKCHETTTTKNNQLNKQEKGGTIDFRFNKRTSTHLI